MPDDCPIQLRFTSSRKTRAEKLPTRFAIFAIPCCRERKQSKRRRLKIFAAQYADVLRLVFDPAALLRLSKIIGELMMLIQPDKRGKEHAIQMSCSQNAGERFYIPENPHLIGMMITADRSLAMVDYALRRRFRFITLRPEFGGGSFGKLPATGGAAPELTKKIVSRMNALNEVISAEAKYLCAGYLCPTPVDSIFRAIPQQVEQDRRRQPRRLGV